MKRYNVILESNVEPKDKNVLWLQGNKLKKFGNTGWEDIGNEALALGAFHGYFPDSSSLPTNVTTPGYAYVGLDNPYKIWKFNGELWSDSGTYIDVNDADEEDITRNTEGKLQFKDRAYGDGMGYVILRKDKTFAEQVTEDNTIYEVRYNFNLKGEEVTIPEGCVLKFEGGKINNCTLNGTYTKIESNITAIFNNITIIGLWNIPIVYPEWFGAIGNGIADDTAALQLWGNCLTSCNHCLIAGKTYYIKNPIIFHKSITVISTQDFRKYAKPKILIDTNFSKESSIFVIEGTMSSVEGIEFAVSTKSENNTYTGITCHMIDNNSNMDTNICGCTFTNLDYGIRYYGRGLVAKENTFIYAINGIRQIMCHNFDVEPTYPNLQLPPWDGRNLIVENNRMHTFQSNGYMLYIAKNETLEISEEYVGISVSNNLLDAGGGLFCTYAPIKESKIKGNICVCNLRGAPSYPIRVGAAVKQCIISDNIFGSRFWNEEDIVLNSVTTFIHFDNTVKGAIISNNQFFGAKFGPIEAISDIDGLCFMNNIIAQNNMDQMARGLISTIGKIDKAIIMYNIELDGKLHFIIWSTSKSGISLSNTKISSNILTGKTDIFRPGINQQVDESCLIED